MNNSELKLPDCIEVHDDYDVCTCCGNIVTYYTECLQKNMIYGLIELYNFGGAAKLKDLQLDNNVHNNFQKLQYFDLAYRSGSQIWKITEFGKRFLKGDQPCYTRLKRRKDHIISYEGDLVYISDLADLDYIKDKDYYQEQIKNQ